MRLEAITGIDLILRNTNRTSLSVKVARINIHELYKPGQDDIIEISNGQSVAVFINKYIIMANTI